MTMNDSTGSARLKKKDCDHMRTVISDSVRQEARGTNFEKLLEILSG
jgi:hypothetical protein